METGPSTYTLNAWQFEQALAILQREQQAHTPSATQEKSFKLLYPVIYGFGIMFLFLMELMPERVSKVFGIIYVITFTILAIGSLTLFLLNLPYISGLLRQRRLARKLGLWEALRAPWRTERRQNKLRNVLDLYLFILGLYLAWTALRITFYYSLYSLDNIIIFSVVLVIGGATLATIFVRRSKEQLGLISRLYSSLEGYKEEVKQDKDGHIHLPTEAYEKIAQIERAQITRGRVQSILSGLDKAGASPYVVQKSHAAQQAQARLDTTTRLRVQDQVDALMTEPYPAGLTRDSKAGAFHLRVPETPVIIGFTVNEQARRIQILSVESTSDAAKSSSELGE